MKAVVLLGEKTNFVVYAWMVIVKCNYLASSNTKPLIRTGENIHSFPFLFFLLSQS